MDSAIFLSVSIWTTDGFFSFSITQRNSAVIGLPVEKMPENRKEMPHHKATGLIRFRRKDPLRIPLCNIHIFTFIFYRIFHSESTGIWTILEVFKQATAEKQVRRI